MTIKTYIEEEICDIDRKDVDDPQAIAEFAEDVCQHMLKTEKEFIPTVGYMTK